MKKCRAESSRAQRGSSLIWHLGNARRSLAALGMTIALGLPAYADVYKWVDSQGVTHFSDTPHVGAEPITIQPIQSYSPAPISKEAPVKEAPAFSYESVTVTSPEDKATVRNNQGFVPVMVAIKPELQKGDTLQLIYDDKPIGEPQTSLGFMINNINRGAHTLAVQVMDASGKVILKSDVVTFFMHKAYIVNQPRP